MKIKAADFAGEGLTLFGAADISGLNGKILLPDEIKKNFRSAVSIGYCLSRTILDTLAGGPNQLYYFHYQRVNILLDSAALKIAGAMQDAGYESMPVPASQITDRQKMAGVISHRDTAIKAGLAWHGRNNLAVNPRYGAGLRFATILTSARLADLDNGDASHFSLKGCGSCRACVAACPAGAIGQTPADFKIELCINKLKEFQKELNSGQMICGMCIKACRGAL